MSPGVGFPGGGGGIPRQLYGFGLLLLALLFFLLTFRGKVPKVVDRVFATPSAITEAQIQERRALVATWLDGAYHDPADGESFKETDGYVRLLRKLIDHVHPGEVVADPPLFDRNLAVATPELQRGETVKVRGIVAKLWAEKLDRPVFQLHDVWRVFMTDVNGDDGFVVDVIERPPALEERRDVVELTGTFYRLVGYEATSGQRQVIPYLLARSLAVVPYEHPAAFGLNDPAVIVLLVALAAMVVWGIMRVVSSRARRQGIRWRAPHLG